MTDNRVTIITLPNGRTFPAWKGKPLPWVVGSNFTLADKLEGYPKTRAIIRAMIVLRPELLEHERKVLRKSSFDRLFGKNAKNLLDIVEEEISNNAVSVLYAQE